MITRKACDIISEAIDRAFGTEITQPTSEPVYMYDDDRYDHIPQIVAMRALNHCHIDSPTQFVAPKLQTPPSPNDDGDYSKEYYRFDDAASHVSCFYTTAIIRKEIGESNRFILYPRANLQQLVRTYRDVATLHETIPPCVPCRMFIDIENKKEIRSVEDYDNLRTYILQKLKSVKDKFTIGIYETPRPLKNKISFHVIFNDVFMKNIAIAKSGAFTFLSNLLGREFVEGYVDCAVYRNKGGLRLLGSGKLSSDGITRIFKQSIDPNDTDYSCGLIIPLQRPGAEASYIVNIERAVVNENETVANLHLVVGELESILKVKIPSYLPNSIVVSGITTDARGILHIAIRRVRAFLCPICDRAHENENMSVAIYRNKIGYYSCFRAERDSKQFKFDCASILKLIQK